MKSKKNFYEVHLTRVVHERRTVVVRAADARTARDRALRVARGQIEANTERDEDDGYWCSAGASRIIVDSLVDVGTRRRWA